jgi:predicted nucleic acid-binding protein
MEWLARLEQTTVGLDAAPLIYYLEEHPRYLPLVDPFFEALDRGAFHVVASTVVLLEVLVHPLRHANARLAQAYRDILRTTDALTLVPVSPEIAEQAAQLRARFSIKTPDAIHLATALHRQAAYFITNDTRLPAGAGVEIISLDTLLGQTV